MLRNGKQLPFWLVSTIPARPAPQRYPNFISLISDFTIPNAGTLEIQEARQFNVLSFSWRGNYLVVSQLRPISALPLRVAYCDPRKTLFNHRLSYAKLSIHHQHTHIYTECALGLSADHPFLLSLQSSRRFIFFRYARLNKPSSFYRFLPSFLLKGMHKCDKNRFEHKFIVQG